MPKSQFLIFILSAAFCLESAFAHSSDPIDPRHFSGPELFEMAQNIVHEENGTLIQVPADYRHPQDRKTWLYFSRPFGWNPKRPTVIFFLGGPGETIHGAVEQFRGLVPEGYNFVTFDVRGSGFSRSTWESESDSDYYYNSVTTAHDAEEIRKYLGIEQWSVMGSSYGSIPATLYAGVFAMRTRAVILGGTIFLNSGAPTLFQLRQWSLRKMLLDLGLSSDFLSREGVLQKIEERLTIDGTFGFLDFIESLQNPAPNSVQMGEVPTVMGRLNMDGLVDEFYKREMGSEPTQPIDMKTYPIFAPVTYVHGSHDPRTPEEGMRMHYDLVPRGFKQKLILQGAGHLALSLVPPGLLAHLLDGRPVEEFTDARCARLLLNY